MQEYGDFQKPKILAQAGARSSPKCDLLHSAGVVLKHCLRSVIKM